MIYETCSRCGNMIPLAIEGRLPLWCPRCGADFKPQLPPTVDRLGVAVASPAPQGSITANLPRKGD